MLLLLSALLLGLAQDVNAAKRDNAKIIDHYRIYESTAQYPAPHFYEQLMECGQEGGVSVGFQNSISPAPVSGSVPPIFDPGNGSGTGSGSGVGIGTGSGSGNSGPIIVLPGTGVGPGTGTGSGTGGVYIPPSGDVMLDQIVNIGNLIWQIVDRGRPTAKIATYRAHALPKGIQCWTDLENWNAPTSKVFTVEYKNKIGQVVALFSYRISYVYGGNINGVGKYLANVTVSPVNIQVNWGFDFASEVQIPAVFNVGNRNSPVAGMQVFVYWSLGNALKTEQRSSLFFVSGDGKIQVTPQ